MPCAVLFHWSPREAGEDTRRFTRAASAFPSRVRRMQADERSGPNWRLRTWSHRASHFRAPLDDRRTGAVVAIVGSPLRSGLAQIRSTDDAEPLLAQAARDWHELVDSLSPPWAMIRVDPDRGEAAVATDRLGLQHLYITESDDGVWLSSSAYALTAVAPTSIDVEGLLEWLPAGHFVTQRTFYEGVRKLGPGERFRLEGGGISGRALWRPMDGPEAQDGEYRARVLDAVRVAEEPPRVMGELTGGLDSRFVLAARAAAGVPLDSYTLGDAGSADVAIARQLARAGGFRHEVISPPSTSGERAHADVQELFDLCDGELNCVEYGHLIGAYEQLDGVRDATISGLGGELVRAFYYMWTPSAADVLGRRMSPVLLRRLSRLGGPLAALVRPEIAPDPLVMVKQGTSRWAADSPFRQRALFLEDFYIRSRMQRFAGRSISTQELFCRSGLPLFANGVVDAALRLPVDRKRSSDVLRDAVAAWAPDLASLALDTGEAVATPRGRARHLRRQLWRVRSEVGRRRRPPSPSADPWARINESGQFRAFASDALLTSESRLAELVDPDGLRRLVHGALEQRRSFFAFGLAVTAELVLRRGVARP